MGMSLELSIAPSLELRFHQTAISFRLDDRYPPTWPSGSSNVPFQYLAILKAKWSSKSHDARILKISLSIKDWVPEPVQAGEVWQREAKNLEEVIASFEKFFALPELCCLPSCSQRKCGFDAWDLKKQSQKNCRVQEPRTTGWSQLSNFICLWTAMAFGSFKFQMFKTVEQIWITR